MNDKEKTGENIDDKEPKIYGNPEYAAADDIYNHEEKVGIEELGEDGEINDSLSEGLDVPGSELDDKDEAIGEEDEENNFYSLGGDSKDNLEESEDD